MSVSGLLNIGITAMQTTNQLLDITSHNVANANTPGYTRQDAILESIPSGSITSTGSTGNGVQITEIQRMYDSFVSSQLNSENSNLAYWNNYQTGMTQVQDVFNEASTTGISPAITQFYTDWQNVSQSPQDDAQRTTLIQDANYLSSRLSSASSSLNNERTQLFTDSQSLVSQVNTDAKQIANLNAMIAGNSGALDLEDQRDALVQNLNSIVKVSTFTDNGAINVMLGGTPLVEGAQAYTMSANVDTNNMMHFYIATVPGAAEGSAANPDVTSRLSGTGGQLQANLYLRDTTIPAYITKLNAFAVDLAATTNYYQKQGYGLDGSPGGNLFQPLTTEAKYTSAGFTTDPSTTTFTANGGTLTIKLGDNDTTPATVNVSAGATLTDVVNDINTQAGSKVAAAVVNLGTSTSPDYRISIKSNPDGNLDDVRIGVTTTDSVGAGLDLLATSPVSEYTITAGVNDTITTDKGSFTVPAGIYTGVDLQNAINAQSATLGINVAYSATTSQFTITKTTATDLESCNMEPLLGFTNAVHAIGGGITGTPSISTPAAPGAVISSVNVTNPNNLDPKAQYKIDYVNTAGYNLLSAADQANYQQEGTSGIYWRVMKSDDGSTWTSIAPNTSYPSNSSSLDETKVNMTTDSNSFSRTLEFEGVEVSIDGDLTGSNPNGGTFAVQLDPNAAGDIKTVITDPNKVAASTDMFTVNSTNNTVAFSVTTSGVTTNYTAVIPSGSYTNDPGQPDDISSALTTAIQNAYQTVTGSALPDTLSAVFNPNTKQFKVMMTNAGTAGDTINLQWSNPASTGKQLFGFIGCDTQVAIGSSAVSDNPASVLSSANQGVPGDNRNANNIANLTSGTSFGGTTPVDMYMSLVSDVGVNAASANNSQQYESNLVDQLTQRKSEVSGVSLDQEAANLVIYEKSYQAAAQLITVANSLLTTLLNMVSGQTGG